MSGVIPRSELWRRQYRGRRYLKDVRREELAERLRDVMRNIATLNKDGRIGVKPIDEMTDYWWSRFAHIHEEFLLRGEGPPDGFLDFTVVPKPTYPDPPPAAKATKSYTPPSSFLIKYGRREHILPMVDAGRIRIAPASYYGDPSLNHAIHDDEMSFSYVIPKDEVKSLTVKNNETGEEHVLNLASNLKLGWRASTDYYVYCLSGSLALRHFDDFDYDAGLLLKEPDSFLNRLSVAVKTQLPGWRVYTDRVTYRDPFDNPETKLDVYFSKSFKFAYQDEYRVVWLPPAKLETPLQPIFVELGSLRDEADLIEIVREKPE